MTLDKPSELPPDASSIDWREYAAGVETQIAEIKDHLRSLESGETKVSRAGDGEWRDVTQAAIARERRILQAYEEILAAVRRRLQEHEADNRNSAEGSGG